MKTIISANIPIALAIRLKDKTKGTRSRVISRALEAYLDEKDAFDLWEIPTVDILRHVQNRRELSNSQREIIFQMKEDLK